MIKLSAEEKAAMGERIRAGRYVAGLSIRDLAHALGVTPAAYMKWEHGSVPQPVARARLAKLYGVDEPLLFAEYEAHMEAARALLRPA